MLKKSNYSKNFGEKKFEDEGYSIRVGHWGYFITHEACYTPDTRTGYSKTGIAYDMYDDCTPTPEAGYCGSCLLPCPKEMIGLINLMLWEK